MWYNNGFHIYIDPKAKSVKKLASFKNWHTFQFKFFEYCGDAINRYKITGLPDTVSERVVLESLLWYGCVFFFEKNDNLIALPGMPDGSGLNIYGDYAGAWVYGANGYNEHVDVILPGADNSKLLQQTNSGYKAKDGTAVMVRENAFVYPFMNTVIYYANTIADTMRTLDVARENIKRPYIITAEESVIPSIKQYFNNVNNNEPFVISSGIFPADKVSVLPFDKNPEYVHITSELIDWYDQKFREACGIKNMGGQIDKKGENLISDEVTQNDEYTRNRHIQWIDSLNRGFDVVNELAGTNIKCVEAEHENVQRDDREQSGDISDNYTRNFTNDNI